MKKYAFFDVDQTLYNGYCTSTFYLFLANRHYIKNEDDIYTKDKQLGKDFELGKMDYAEISKQVVLITAEILKGTEEEIVKKWQKEFMTYHNNLFGWVKDLFNLLKEKNFQIYLISGGASPGINAIASYLKIDNVHASNLVIKNGIYTGETEQFLNYEEKTKLIHRIIGHLPHSFKIGFGDSVGDVDMLSYMDKSFLYNPQSQELKKIAEEKQWHIVNENTIIPLVKQHI